MGSPITFSGFNQIDFNVVLNALMQQESRPLQALQTQQQALQATDGAYGQLAAKLDSLRSAAQQLSGTSLSSIYAAHSNDTAVAVSATASAVPGQYDVVVNALARAQVTVSATNVPDTDTTTVAQGGTLTIGGVEVALTGPVTLRQLATAIDTTSGVPVRAGIVETAPGEFRLVLTSRQTGAASGFTVENALASSSISFADTDHDGSSGDTPADNAVQATDAAVVINNIPVTSASNTLAAGIPGVSVTLLEEDPSKTIVVTVARDEQAQADRIGAFVDAYNAFVKFAREQTAATGNGATGALGRDSLLRSLRGLLRGALTQAYGQNAYTRLAEVGIALTRTGELTLDRNALDAAVTADPAAVDALFADPGSGAFTAIEGLIEDFTSSGGFVPDARRRVNEEVGRLNARMADMQARLLIRRESLQREFIAADALIARLNSQLQSIGSFGASLTTNAI